MSQDLMYQIAYGLLGIFAATLACFVIGWVLMIHCKHRNPSWPFHGKQKCHDCGAERVYRFGGPMGRWTR